MDTYLISYDIRNPKRLHKVTKTMKQFGEHRQYSVFECRLSEVALLRLKDRLENIIDKDDDQVLIIKPCSRCFDEIQTIGLPRVVSPEGFQII